MNTNILIEWGRLDAAPLTDGKAAQLVSPAEFESLFHNVRAAGRAVPRGLAGWLDERRAINDSVEYRYAGLGYWVRFTVQGS